jgi:hypothetical protein
LVLGWRGTETFQRKRFCVAQGRGKVPIDFLSVLLAFHERNVRYVLVGGLAVLLHGKEAAGRPKDLDDAARLIALRDGT